MVPASCYTHFACDPRMNMAVDETLFRMALDTPGYIALRLYTWRPGAITFGVNQRFDKAVDHTRLGDTPLIRRVTGGRALYHDESELTYAVAVNTEGLNSSCLGGSVARSSAAIAAAITGFLARLGMQSQYLRHTVQSDRRPAFFHAAPCFASTARHEIVSARGKIVASAQRRIGSTWLQHGSIKLAGVAYHAALDGAVCPDDRAVGLHPVTAEEFRSYANLFFREMGEGLGLACEAKVLSAEERELVEERRALVTKFSLARRDMIKQAMPGVSL